MAYDSRKVLAGLMREFAFEVFYLEGRLRPFRTSKKSKRKYPGEAEAAYVLSYLGATVGDERRQFLKTLRDRQKANWIPVSAEKQNANVGPPKPNKDFALLALTLLLKQNRLARLRTCKRCRAWYYARFKSQRFCSDPEKKCQWKHYHTDEWRRQNRARNRDYQKKYRGY